MVYYYGSFVISFDLILIFFLFFYFMLESLEDTAEKLNIEKFNN